MADDFKQEKISNSALANTRSDEEKYTDSELLMYVNLCIERAAAAAEQKEESCGSSGSTSAAHQGYEMALKHLKEIRPKVVDVTAWQVKRSELLLLLGRWEEAHGAWSTLTAQSPENYRYHTGLQVSIFSGHDF